MRIVSACLAGVRCRWDGGSRPSKAVIGMVRKGEAIPVCPEQLGGLPTPRPAAEIMNGKAITTDGRNETREFRKGAEEALKIARLAGCKEAILKSKSPSCGSGEIYDGTFSGKLAKGDGITAALLKRNGIMVCTEECI